MAEAALFEDDNEFGNATELGGGYGFEPVLTAEQRSKRQRQGLEAEVRKNLVSPRMLYLDTRILFRFNRILQKDLPEQRLISAADWCRCRQCSVDNLRQPKECYCCRELPVKTQLAQKVRKKLDGVQCITANENFSKMCPDKEVSCTLTKTAAFLTFSCP